MRCRLALLSGFAVLSGMGLIACTAPNPRSCADGLCTDQRYPYCDADGTFEGTPDTCIAVDCEPSSFVRCLADQSVKCNAAGNDYTIVMCEQGCNDATGCRQCSSNDQCTAASPICDSGGACRACVLDDECSSRVCQSGACIAETGVLYASSGGGGNSACTKADPCNIAHASLLAETAAVQPVIRLLPGSYAAGLAFDRPTNSPLVVVATGATIVANTAVAITGGADVWIRGPELTATVDIVTCDSSTGSSRLRLSDSVLSASDTALARVDYCQLRLEASDLRINSSNFAAVYLGNNAAFSGDRLRIRGTPDHQAIIGTVYGSRVRLELTNSLLEYAPIQFTTGDTTSPGSLATFGNNTFVVGVSGTYCPSTGTGSAFRTMIYDNNIVFGAGSFDVVTGTGCQLHNNVVYPQATALAGNILGDPQFVDATGGDYHLKSSSPAVDHGVATPRFPSVSADLDGVSRPQGAAPDIGAYERRP